MPEKSVNELLKDKFDAKHVDAMVRHFRNIVSDYQEGEWEDANAKAGKFVEATLKALWRAAGETVPKGKAFKAGNIMDQLGQKTVLPDSLRVTVPRACRFI
jgi:HEPN domain-containing protein